MDKACGVVGAVLCTLVSTGLASAGVIGFVSNATGNSADFAASVAANGGTITTLNFNTHPVGPLIPSFYPGVTLSGTGGFGNVTTGAGPGQPNVSTPPVSLGEGPHAASNYVGSGGLGTFVVSFSTPALGVGLFTIDLFNPASQPSGRNPVTIQAFTGPNGTGTSLGLFDSAQFNFQRNNLYFMGVVSTSADIGSLVFNSPGAAADVIGLDDVQYATGGQGVPEPSSLLLIGGCLIVFGWRRGMRAGRS